MTTTEQARARGAFRRITMPGFETIDGRKAKVFADIRFDGRRLSISAVVGPMANGDCRGSCGQCVGSVRECELAAEWTEDMRTRLVEVWERWHLNDMRAGCEHQRALGWTNENMSQPCPTCGYKYGHAWLFEQVPSDVLDFLESLPTSDDMPTTWQR